MKDNIEIPEETVMIISDDNIILGVDIEGSDDFFLVHYSDYDNILVARVQRYDTNIIGSYNEGYNFAVLNIIKDEHKRDKIEYIINEMATEEDEALLMELLDTYSYEIIRFYNESLYCSSLLN